MNLQQLFAFLLAIPMTFFAAGGSQEAGAFELPEHDADAAPIHANHIEAAQKSDTSISALRTKQPSKAVKAIYGMLPFVRKNTEIQNTHTAADENLIHSTAQTMRSITVRYERLSDGKAGA